jgi:hypothetical protein
MKYPWMMWCGRLLAAAWAAWWSFFAIASSFGDGTAMPTSFLPVAATIFILICTVLVAWKNEAAGAALLLAEGIVACLAYPAGLLHARSSSQMAFVILTAAGPALLAGALLLADHRSTQSRKPT